MADAVVVGSGPNGLAAAIALAKAGRGVSLLEGQETVGGGCRSAALTLPGFVHDTCSTVHALALASPFLSRLPLAEHGFEAVHPEAPLAHPLDDGTAVMLERSVDRTAGSRESAGGVAVHAVVHSRRRGISGHLSSPYSWRWRVPYSADAPSVDASR